MDAVYILGAGSPRNNEEIRYSIRSLVLNMLDLRNIYIVGDCPSFLPFCKHIPAEDLSDKKYVNAFNKISLACSIDDISDEFLLMNDDFFMLEPFNGSEFPFYALENSNGGACGLNSFQVHCPIRIKKDWFSQMPFDLSFKSCQSPRTFYANFYRAPIKKCSDFILSAGEHVPPFEKQIKGLPCFSISNSTIQNDEFYEWLKTLYPIASRFELKTIH